MPPTIPITPIALITPITTTPPHQLPDNDIEYPTIGSILQGLQDCAKHGQDYLKYATHFSAALLFSVGTVQEFNAEGLVNLFKTSDCLMPIGIAIDISQKVKAVYGRVCQSI